MDGKVPEPKQPPSFVKGNQKAGAKKPNNFNLGAGDSDDEQPKNFFEPISYAKLMRVIGKYHPIDKEAK